MGLPPSSGSTHVAVTLLLLFTARDGAAGVAGAVFGVWDVMPRGLPAQTVDYL